MIADHPQDLTRLFSGERRIARQKPGGMREGDVEGCGGLCAHAGRSVVARPGIGMRMVDDPDDTRCGMRTSPGWLTGSPLCRPGREQSNPIRTASWAITLI
jgi:hypothetical protein